ncbi:Ephrin type-B receptor 1, partial [Paramuricea clavata]
MGSNYRAIQCTWILSLKIIIYILFNTFSCFFIGELGPKALGDWKDLARSQGNVDHWDYRQSKLITVIRAGSGASWFFTPMLANTPNTSYLDIEAACTNNPFRLEIYGSSDSSFKNLESIQNVTFEKRSLNTATIEKSYRYLCILVRATSQTTFYIYSIKMYHYFCEKTTMHNIILSQVDSSTTNISVRVQCGDNAVASDRNSTNITANCTPKGNWIFGNQKCVCVEGFQSSNQECSRCLTDYYKNVVGDEACHKCPDGKTNNMMHTKCKCKKDHYIGDNESGPCFVVPSKVVDLKLEQLTNTSVNITWRKPKDNDGFNGSLTYTVMWYPCINESKCDTIDIGKNATNLANIIVPNLTLYETYKFKVFSIGSILQNVSDDKWKFAEKNFTLKAVVNKVTTFPTTTDTNTMTPGTSNNKGKDKDNIFIYIGAGVATVVIVLLIVLLIISRWQRGKSKKSGKDNLGFERDISLHYVDPITYADPERAVSELANELDRHSIKLETIIGGGQFGDVYKGEMKLPEQPATKVAIKKLKPGASYKDRTDFLIEASVMGQFKNLNVITLEGVVTKSTPFLIVTEFMENGSLDKYLKENDGMLNQLQLLRMARGVASGMEYLAGMNFVHRDLAARNVLVNENLICKVADFGLSRDLDNTEDSEYESQGGKIAVRWTAPEAITYLKFSTASDIWSYGILLWEIMSFAEKPYRNWRNGEVVIFVNQGYRLLPPMTCPKTVHELMKECWMTDRTKRPPFKEIVRIIDEWIKYPEKLLEDYVKVR